MRFHPSDEAVALRDAVAGVLTAVTPATVRAGWPGGDVDVLREPWRKLAAAGLAGALVPESHGGSGVDDEAVVAALEAVGYSGLPLPVVETVAVAAPVLAAAESPWLADVLSGQAMVAVPPRQTDTDLLPYGQDTELALWWEGDAMRLLTRAELVATPQASIDGSRRLVRVSAVRGGALVSDDPTLARQAAARGALGSAAVLVGLSRRLLDLTVGYVKQREQFGAPVGSFQAIKHTLASALIALRFARPTVLAAGWALARQQPDAEVEVSLAKAQASEAALQIARTAIQCHGAIAYTTEYDLHLFAKRVWALAPAWGDAQWHRARIAAHLGMTATAAGAVEPGRPGR